MTRDMFLQELRIALQGQIAQVEVNEQLQYYENYIIEESRKGRTEVQVIESLGSPRLIAKTIIQMYGGDTREAGERETFSKQEEQGRRDTRFGRVWFWPLRRKMLSGILSVVFLVLLLRVGIVLLPFLASVFMTGAMFYIIFLIFFGNKK